MDDEVCPVCLNSAEMERDKDYGDKKQVRCMRCGPYQMSRTAIAILVNRAEQTPLLRARLSHAIRSRAAKEPWFLVTSTDLDALLQKPLPDVSQQLRNLLRWLQTELRDDWLGNIPCPWPETLAGVVGAVDGARVEKLLDCAVKQGVIERDMEKDTIGLTPGSWNVMEASERRAVNPTAATTKPSEANSVRAAASRYEGSIEWDVFISHASEDKDEFARPLAERLRECGLKVWFAEFTLTVGDSLRQAIDRGLARSRFGVVVISPNFLQKNWPQRELDGLVAREVRGTKVILPVWHRISVDEILTYSPVLADRLAASSEEGLHRVAEKLLEAIRNDRRNDQELPESRLRFVTLKEAAAQLYGEVRGTGLAKEWESHAGLGDDIILNFAGEALVRVAVLQVRKSPSPKWEPFDRNALSELKVCNDATNFCHATGDRRIYFTEIRLLESEATRAISTIKRNAHVFTSDNEDDEAYNWIKARQ